MNKLSKLAIESTFLCVFAAVAQAQGGYAITLTASLSSAYIPSTQSITIGATISPGAGDEAVTVNVTDTTGNIVGTIVIPEHHSTNSTDIAVGETTLTANTTDEVSANITGGSTSNTVPVNLVVNTPTIRFLALTLDSGNSTTATASIAVPTDFAITVNTTISPRGSLNWSAPDSAGCDVDHGDRDGG